jgi:hypothetical protein
VEAVKPIPRWLDDGPDHGTLRVVVGCDVGQLRDPTAVVVAEPVRRPTGKMKDHVGRSGTWRVPFHETAFLIRHVERMPLRTSFRHVGQRLAEIVHNLDLVAGPDRRFKPYVMVDRTGLGQAAIELVREEIGTRIPVTGTIITVGERITGHLGAWEVRVPKAQMVSRLQALLQHDLIELPELPEAQLLADELKSFQVHQTVRGIRAEGEPGTHDDMVTALALAVLFDPYANRARPGPPLDW